MELKITSAVEPLRAEIAGAESLEASNSAALKEEFVSKVPVGKNMILSLACIQSVDSAGVGALVTLLKMVRKGGGRLGLVGINPQVYSVLDIIRLTTVFEIFPDEQAAVTAFAPAQVR